MKGDPGGFKADPADVLKADPGKRRMVAAGVIQSLSEDDPANAGKMIQRITDRGHQGRDESTKFQTLNTKIDGPVLRAGRIQL